MAESIDVEGMRELRKALRIAGNKDLRKELRLAQKSSANIVATVAQATVPHKSGKLRSSIRPGASMRSGYVKVGSKRVPYAGPIHFGWRRRGISANPFLFEALALSRDKVVREHQSKMDDLVAKIHRNTP